MTGGLQLPKKFSKFPWIQTLHDFVYTIGPSSVVATVRKLCSTGLYEQSTIATCCEAGLQVSGLFQIQLLTVILLYETPDP